MKPRTMVSGHIRNCLCPDCRELRRKNTQWKKLYLGDKPVTMPANDARTRINAWKTRGWTNHHLAVLAGVSDSTIKRLARGEQQRIDRALNRRVALIRPTPHNAPNDETNVPSYGATRRVRALMRNGYTCANLADIIGQDVRRISHSTDPVCTAKTWLAIDQAYRNLCMTFGGSPITASRARKAGWAPPLAWDDIDDPNETPKGVAA